MDQLLQEWHSLDNDAFLEAIDEASHKNEYVPVVPEDEVFHYAMYFHIIEEEKGFWKPRDKEVSFSTDGVLMT